MKDITIRFRALDDGSCGLFFKSDEIENDFAFSLEFDDAIPVETLVNLINESVDMIKLEIENPTVTKF